MSSLIKPKKPVFKAPSIERAIQNTLTAIAKDIKIDHDVTTQTWEHRATFTITSPTPYERLITTDDKVYSMLDAGTAPHMIRPKRGKVLRFQSPFRSKTLPNQIMSRAGSTGSAEVYSRGVRHPGTKPRNWAKTIAAKWRKQAPLVMGRMLNAEYR